MLIPYIFCKSVAQSGLLTVGCILLCDIQHKLYCGTHTHKGLFATFCIQLQCWFVSCGYLAIKNIIVVYRKSLMVFHDCFRVPRSILVQHPRLPCPKFFLVYYASFSLNFAFLKYSKLKQWCKIIEVYFSLSFWTLMLGIKHVITQYLLLK
jgi:hypothetical protein